MPKDEPEEDGEDDKDEDLEEPQLSEDALQALRDVNPTLKLVSDLFNGDGCQVETALSMRTLHLFGLIGEAISLVSEKKPDCTEHCADLKRKVDLLSSEDMVCALVSKEFQMPPGRKDVFSEIWTNILLMEVPSAPGKKAQSQTNALTEEEVGRLPRLRAEEQAARTKELKKNTIAGIWELALREGVKEQLESEGKRNAFNKIGKPEMVAWMATYLAFQKHPERQADQPAKPAGEGEQDAEDELDEDDWMLNAVHALLVEVHAEADEGAAAPAQVPPLITYSGLKANVGDYVAVPETDRQTGCFLGFKIASAVQLVLDKIDIGAVECCAHTVQRKVIAKKGKNGLLKAELTKALGCQFKDCRLVVKGCDADSKKLGGAYMPHQTLTGEDSCNTVSNLFKHSSSDACIFFDEITRNWRLSEGGNDSDTVEWQWDSAIAMPLFDVSKPMEFTSTVGDASGSSRILTVNAELRLMLPFLGRVTASRGPAPISGNAMHLGVVKMRNGISWTLYISPTSGMLSSDNKSFAAAWSIPTVSIDKAKKTAIPLKLFNVALDPVESLKAIA